MGKTVVPDGDMNYSIRRMFGVYAFEDNTDDFFLDAVGTELNYVHAMDFRESVILYCLVETEYLAEKRRFNFV